MRAAFLLMVPLLVACPPDPEQPTQPSGARACSIDADCQPDGGPTCGAITTCVDARCEDEPSRFVPCP